MEQLYRRLAERFAIVLLSSPSPNKVISARLVFILYVFFYSVTISLKKNKKKNIRVKKLSRLTQISDIMDNYGQQFNKIKSIQVFTFTFVSLVDRIFPFPFNFNFFFQQIELISLWWTRWVITSFLNEKQQSGRVLWANLSIVQEYQLQ